MGKLLSVKEIERENKDLRIDCDLVDVLLPDWVDTPELIRQNIAILPYAKEIEKISKCCDEAYENNSVLRDVIKIQQEVFLKIYKDLTKQQESDK